MFEREGAPTCISGHSGRRCSSWQTCGHLCRTGGGPPRDRGMRSRGGTRPRQPQTQGNVGVGMGRTSWQSGGVGVGWSHFCCTDEQAGPLYSLCEVPPLTRKAGLQTWVSL